MRGKRPCLFPVPRTAQVGADGGIALSDSDSSDPHLNDAAPRQSERAGGKWAWLAGLAVLAFIAIVLVAGWDSNGNGGSTVATPLHPSSPSTTGSGATSP
jgi:hypothetical protein